MLEIAGCGTVSTPRDFACPRRRSATRARVPLRSESRNPHANPHAADAKKAIADHLATRNTTNAPLRQCPRGAPGGPGGRRWRRTLTRSAAVCGGRGWEGSGPFTVTLLLRIGNLPGFPYLPRLRGPTFTQPAGGVGTPRFGNGCNHGTSHPNQAAIRIDSLRVFNYKHLP